MGLDAGQEYLRPNFVGPDILGIAQLNPMARRLGVSQGGAWATHLQPLGAMDMFLIWTVSILLLLASLIYAIANARIAVRWYVWRIRASLIPFVGGLSGAIGVMLLPVDAVWRFWWIPPVADIGCAALLASIVVAAARRWLAKNRKF